MDSNRKFYDFIKKHSRIILSILSTIFSFYTAYLTNFYKSLTLENYYGIPVFILILLTGILVGFSMSATINNNQIENNPDSFFIELPLQVIEVEGEFHEILGVKLKTIGKSPSKQVLPSVYCPDCQIKMFERKTFLGMYKFECAKCGTVKKLKYSKRELMEVIASK